MEIIKENCNILNKICLSSNPVCVIGEIVLDKYIFGVTERISREAPVLILRYSTEENIPGGAGNTINNLADLELKVIPVSILGNDPSGNFIIDYFKKKKIDISSVILSNNIITTEKTRIMAGGSNTVKQQVIRIDKIENNNITETLFNKIKNNLEKNTENIDYFIISDYDVNIFSDDFINHINTLSKTKKVIVDSRHKLNKFQNPYFITPNDEEAREITGFKESPNLNYITVAKKLMKITNAENVLITMGKNGMCYVGSDGEKIIPTFNSEPAVDVTGAGDTVISSLTYGLTIGLSPLEAVFLSSVAANIVVMKKGTATVSIAEIKKELEKICHE